MLADRLCCGLSSGKLSDLPRDLRFLEGDDERFPGSPEGVGDSEPDVMERLGLVGSPQYGPTELLSSDICFSSFFLEDLLGDIVNNVFGTRPKKE